MTLSLYIIFFFFFNDTATTEIYTLSLHDALPIWANGARRNEFGFGDGQTFNEDVGGFTLVRSFVNGGGHHGERESSVAQDFGAADRGRGEDELHRESRDFRRGRIL